MATLPYPDVRLASLIDAVGTAAIDTRPAELAFVAQDVHSLGATPLAIFRPNGIEALARGIAAATRAGIAIVPRGGGMSYTRGYLPAQAGALVVDMGAMDRILAIDETDMMVMVEAGCTWAALHAALAAKGLRAPVWGTLSGVKATVGGGMSQNGVFWGASNGPIAESALSFDVVLADGRIARTASGPVRSFGPDVTGLFAADAGAFGIKAHVTLPLVREAAGLAYVSFAFDTPAAAFGTMSEVARAGLASESVGFDPFLQAQRMRRDSLASDAKALVGMMRSQSGFWRGLKEGAKVIAAGRSFLDDARFSAHFTCEGRTAAAAAEAADAITRIALDQGGRAVENSIPKIMRANPFPPVNSMVGPDGERWVPVHGIVRHSRALDAFGAITALYEARAVEMERLGIGAGFLFLTIGTTGFLIEPVFFFPDSMEALHRRSLEPAHLARLRGFPKNDAARALVDELRAGVIAIFGERGAAHFQIGRAYPLAERSDPVAWDVLRALKTALDPDGLMNPGVLGL